MKKIALILSVVMAMTASLAQAESIMKPFNEKGYGTVSGRLQFLGMYRDYEDVKNGGNNTTATDTRLFLTYVF